jgi:hypothetical protein
MPITFIGGHARKSNNSTMLTGFSRLPYGFDLLEGNVHTMDSPPIDELKMLSAQVGPFIQDSSCDLPSSWGTLSKLKALAKHYINQAWYILPSLSPHVMCRSKPWTTWLMTFGFYYLVAYSQGWDLLNRVFWRH